MVHRSIAGHHRNVFLRNDGQGGLRRHLGRARPRSRPGRAGLRRPRLRRRRRPRPRPAWPPAPRPSSGSFATTTAIAARRSPCACSVRDPSGGGGNRDAIGARVTVETDGAAADEGGDRRLRVPLPALEGAPLRPGCEPARRSAHDRLADGRSQEFTRRPAGPPAPDRGGRRRRSSSPTRRRGLPASTSASARRRPPPSAIWLYEPVPAPDFSLPDLRGEASARSPPCAGGPPSSCSGQQRRPRPGRPSSDARRGGATALAGRGVGALAVALDPPDAPPKVRSAAAKVTTLPVVHASEEVALSLRHPPPPPLPERAGHRAADDVPPRRGGTGGQGSTASPLDVAAILRDVPQIEASPDERLDASPALRRDPLLRAARPQLHGLRPGAPGPGPRGPALAAFEQAAQGSPSASTLYRLGTLLVQDRPAGQGAEPRSSGRC